MERWCWPGSLPYRHSPYHCGQFNTEHEQTGLNFCPVDYLARSLLFYSGIENLHLCINKLYIQMHNNLQCVHIRTVTCTICFLGQILKQMIRIRQMYSSLNGASSGTSGYLPTQRSPITQWIGYTGSFFDGAFKLNCIRLSFRVFHHLPTWKA